MRFELHRLQRENQELIDERRQSELNLRTESVMFFAKNQEFERAVLEVRSMIELIEQWRESEERR